MKTPAWLNAPESRQAVQSAIAVAAAIGAGSAISGRRWYWAVIAAFIIVLGVGSRGEATVKALQRVAGTVFGVVVGVALATVVSGHPYAAYALVLICAFFAYYAFQTAYGVMVFFITLMLSVLYGLLGQFKPELLLLRLEETAVGAAIGAATVFFILPMQQNDAFAKALDAYLEALARTLSPDCKGDSAEILGELQAKTQNLPSAHGAFKRQWAGLAHSSYRDTIRAAMRCTYLAREWRLAEHSWEPEAQTQALAARLAKRVEEMRNGARARQSDRLPDQDEPRSFAAECLMALSRGVDALAEASAALRRPKAGAKNT